MDIADYISDLSKSIKTGKIAEAKTLLGQLAARPKPEKLEVLEVLALAPDKTGFELLSFLTGKVDKTSDIYDRLIQLVTDRAHLNYQFAVILFEKCDISTISHAAPLFRHILSNETDVAFLNKIIRTLGKLKIESLTDDIAEFIFFDDAGLKAEAVKALERIGTRRACEKLVQASKTPKCDQDILDAIQVLAADDPVIKNRVVEPVAPVDEFQTDLEQLRSSDIQNRFKAFSTFLEKGSNASAVLSKKLTTKDPDLTINILHLISRTIPVEAVNAVFSILHQKKLDAAIKFAAYNALEAYPELESAASVVQGLSESTLFVRLAAVKTLEKNLSDFVCAEIKNKIESGTKKGETLAETILDAQAKHIIQYLMISDTFSYMASNYLKKKASIKVLDTFMEILEKRKLKSTAKKYMALRKKKTAEKRKQFIVISSSKAILDTYSKLIYACGFSSLIFQRPQDAFEDIVSQKPCAIICDLFLDDMTGMDLARETRELYSKVELPIIISRLQKNFDMDLLQKELDHSGANACIEFPAKTSQIKSWIK